MIQAQIGTYDLLPHASERELAQYRHEVFVQRLGWDLPLTEAGMERDQFDRSGTLYGLVRDAEQRVCGCARLLPTTGPYLLEQVFPHLFDGRPPKEASVWELSRYTTERVHDDGADSREAARKRFQTLLRAVVAAVMRRGARRLITFSYVGVERIARRFGLHVQRAGAVQDVAGRPTLAFWIELDAQTCTALGLQAPRATHPLPMPASPQHTATRHVGRVAAARLPLQAVARLNARG